MALFFTRKMENGRFPFTHRSPLTANSAGAGNSQLEKSPTSRHFHLGADVPRHLVRVVLNEMSDTVVSNASEFS